MRQFPPLAYNPPPSRGRRFLLALMVFFIVTLCGCNDGVKQGQTVTMAPTAHTMREP